MCTRNHSRGGFTLAELLIVMGAIVILIGMVSGGMIMVMRFQLKADTVRLVEQLTEALTLYLDKEQMNSIGMDDSTPTTPNTGMLEYLYKIPKNPYFEPASTYWSTGNINKDLLSPDFLVDAWGNALEYEQWTLKPDGTLANRDSYRLGDNYGKWTYATGSYRNPPPPTPSTPTTPTTKKFQALMDGNVIRSRGPNQTNSSEKDDLIWVYTIAGGWRRYQ